MNRPNQTSPTDVVRTLTKRISLARKQSSAARRQVRSAKAALKAIRKKFKLAKKAAKEARKKIKTLKRELRRAMLAALQSDSVKKKALGVTGKKELGTEKSKRATRRVAKKHPQPNHAEKKTTSHAGRHQLARVSPPTLPVTPPPAESAAGATATSVGLLGSN